MYTDQSWSGGKHVDVKTKANILLDRNGKCLAFESVTWDHVPFGKVKGFELETIFGDGTDNGAVDEVISA